MRQDITTLYHANGMYRRVRRATRVPTPREVPLILAMNGYLTARD